MQAKRIICTVTNDLHQDQRMHRICSALAEAGFEVWLVGRRQKNSGTLPPQAYQQHRLPCYWQRGKLFYLEYNLRLLWFLWRQPAQLINAVDLDTLLPAYLISRLRRIPCVYDAHEYFTETPELTRRPRVQRIWAYLADRIIPRLTYAYTVGGELAQVLQQRYGTRFAVVRNLPLRITPPPSTDAPQQSGPRVILYQGMLNEGRGLETAIQAMHRLPHCQLWLAGDGDIRPDLQKLVDQEKLGEQVKFLGFVPPGDLPALTAQAWLGLNLLENTALSYYYSLANKALDYIQCGLPSINMDFPEYHRLQQQYGVFVLLARLDLALLAQHIQQLMEQPEQYAALRTACLRAAPTLCWEQEQVLLRDFYSRIPNL